MPENQKKEEPKKQVNLDLVKDIITKKDDIQRGRNIQERQWLVNIAFLFGKQHFIAKSSTIASGMEERIIWELTSEERKNSVKKTANYILPLYRSLLARMMLMKAHTSVEPTTNSERDKSAARVASEVLEDFWQMANKHNPVLAQKYAGMPIILGKGFGYSLATGRGYLYPYFNSKTQAKYYMDGVVNEGLVGECETYLLNQFDVFDDPLGKHKIVQRVLSIDDIKAQYGKDVKAEDIVYTDIEQQLVNMLEGDDDNKSKPKNACRIFEYWEIPSEKYSQGRFVVVTAKEDLFDSVIPPEYKGRIPLFEINYLDLLLSQYPQGMVEQLISLQEEYNFTLSKIHAYKKYMNGKLKVPKDAKLEVKYDEEIGQIIFYVNGQEPHFEVPPSPPTYLWEELNRIRRDMEDISAVHDSTKFQQKDVRSGKAIENLDDLDSNALSPILISNEQNLSFFAETVLDIVEAKYSEPRLLGITGDQEVADVKTFKGGDITGNRRVKVNIGTGMPLNKTERQLFIMKLKAEGYIDASKALELMEFGDLSGLYNSVDEQAQKMETSEILAGAAIEVNDWDYHQAHIRVIEKFLKGDQFKKLAPEIQQALLQHRGIHQKFLRAEMMAAANMNPGQPKEATQAQGV